ncbi:hypothetical protein [Sebaldella sp. S0638]|uniref:hypothetical protein n=1 Tax=Sebaldella sp. S0638 TaxID=2957809 RepID=UPI00209CA24B|nr:hypothetical protein [Sebaldella sp. S0638]MCP1226298.1 hypothetical protein [Sebaldella sp. S0638]
MDTIQLDFLKKFSPAFLGQYGDFVVLEIPRYEDRYNSTPVYYNLLSSGKTIDEAELNLAKLIKIISLDENNLINKFIKNMISMNINAFQIKILNEKTDNTFVLQLDSGEYSVRASHQILDEAVKKLYEKFLILYRI